MKKILVTLALCSSMAFVPASAFAATKAPVKRTMNHAEEIQNHPHGVIGVAAGVGIGAAVGGPVGAVVGGVIGLIIVHHHH